jgi:pimeloyl-ACP methyl ester carboxylesterase
MIRIIKIIFVIILLIIIISYFLPTSQKDFFVLYDKEDNASQSLKEFQSRATKTINVDHVAWQYYVRGKGEKTILFLHGMGGAYDLWWQQINALEVNYKVISYSLPENIDSLEKALKGITKILETEKITTFYGVGTSMGGYIMQYLVQKMPNRVEKAVFGNTFSVNDILLTKNKQKSKIIPFLPEIVISKLAEKQLKEKLIPAGKNSKLLASFLPSLPFSKKQFINRYHIVVDPFPLKNNYAIKRIPKLIIESDNDPLVEKELRKDLKNVYHDAKVYTFHKEGHFPYINAAGQYNKVLMDFFNKENTYLEIEKTITNYFNGRKTANINLLKKAFSSDATLHTIKAGKNLEITLKDYFEKVMSDGVQKVETSIIDGNIKNNIATFQTSFIYPKVSYTDYLTLMKIDNKWLITAKTFTKN